MSTLRTPQEALDYIKSYIKETTFDRVWIQAAQDSSDRIWNAAPWRWTMGVITPVTITAGSQQFEVTVPADFERLEQCFLHTVTGVRPIVPVSHIPASVTLVGEPRFVAYVPGATDYVRFDSTLPTLSGTTTFFAQCKLSPPNIETELVEPGGLVMPDMYYHVYEEFVLYYAYRYSYDQRAGSAQINVNPDGKRSVIYTGQLGVAHAALEEMRISEPLLIKWPEFQPPMRQER